MLLSKDIFKILAFYKKQKLKSGIFSPMT